MRIDDRSPATQTRSAGQLSRHARAIVTAPLTIAALFVLATVMLTTTTDAYAAKKLSPAKAVALEKRLGSRASGTYLDRRSGNMVINVGDAATARRVRRAGGIAKIVPRSARQLERITKRLKRTKPIANTAWRIDPVTNRVVLSIGTTVRPADRQRLNAIVRPAGSAVRVETVAPIALAVSGGDEISTPSRICSLGFNVIRGGVAQFLTAGHCTTGTSSWNVPGVTSGAPAWPGDDYGIVRYTDPATPHPSNVDLYNGSFQDITGASEAVVNQAVRKSGRTTGLTAGSVLATGVTVVYDIEDGPDVAVAGMVETNLCVQPGDSGGALFAGATALGITSGATKGECTSRTHSFFNPVVEALNAYGAKIPGANRAPTARFTATRLAGAGNRLALDGSSSSDPDGRVADWRWNVNGAVHTGVRPTVSLGEATASATVTLTVTDDQGATSSSTRTIATANRAPVIDGVSPAQGGVVGSNTPTLAASAHDDDGDALQRSYHLTGPSGVDVASGWVDGAWTVPAHKLDPGTRYEWNVTVRDPRGLTASRSSWLRIGMLPTATEMISVSTGDGYWQVASDGGVFSFGSARFFGSLPGLNVNVTNVIGMARTPDDGGYWIVGRDGGVFAFGDAPFKGSLPGLGVSVNNIVGMAPTKDGQGYWLVGSDGGVFAFGTAQFHGSMGGRPLNAPVARMAPTASGNGYWLVAQDGGVFSFGDAPFYGSLGGTPLNKPVVDIDVAPDGAGYWMTAEDGGVFAFGSATFHGSLASAHLNGHVTSMSPTPDGAGYWLTGCDGGVFSFGNAQFFGSNPAYGCRGT